MGIFLWVSLFVNTVMAERILYFILASKARIKYEGQCEGQLVALLNFFPIVATSRVEKYFIFKLSQV